MGISIQPNSPTTTLTTNPIAGLGKGLNIFDKQIASLQEQLSKIQDDKGLDAESKKNKIKEIEEQIKEIEKQKQVKHIEDMKQSVQKPDSSSSKSLAARDDTQDGVTLNLTKALVNGQNSIQSISKTSAMRKDIINEIRIVEGEDNPTSANEKEQSRLQKALARTTESLYKQIGDTNKEVKESNKKISDAMKAEREEQEVENSTNLSDIKEEVNNISNSEETTPNEVQNNNSSAVVQGKDGDEQTKVQGKEVIDENTTSFSIKKAKTNDLNVQQAMQTNILKKPSKTSVSNEKNSTIDVLL